MCFVLIQNFWYLKFFYLTNHLQLGAWKPGSVGNDSIASSHYHRQFSFCMLGIEPAHWNRCTDLTTFSVVPKMWDIDPRGVGQSLQKIKQNKKVPRYTVYRIVVLKGIHSQWPSRPRKPPVKNIWEPLHIWFRTTFNHHQKSVQSTSGRRSIV